jgi:hypothetical protein
MAMAGSSESSDIGRLWDEALASYEKTTENDLRAHMGKQITVTQLVMQQEQELAAFTSFRHNKGKVDKIRSVIARNADIINNFADLVGDLASAAYPPSATILTAFTLVMSASKHVSEDYDMIEGFFDLMHSFLERLSLIEGKMPREREYQVMLVRVFSSFLDLSAIAHQYCRKRGRLIKWAKALVEKNDKELKGAFDGLNTHLSRLESATIIRTLAAALSASESAKQTQVAVGSLAINTTEILSVQKQELALVSESSLDIKDVLLQGRESAERDADMAATTKDTAATAKRVEGLLKEQLEERKKKDRLRSDKNVDSGDKKSQAMKELKDAFRTDADARMKARHEDLANHFVQGTFEVSKIAQRQL